MVDKNETSNQYDETSEVTRNVNPEIEEVPQECDSTADVKQMTNSTTQPQQQSQSLLVKVGLLGPEHAVDEPASENPAVAESSGDAGNVEPNATSRTACAAAASRGPPLEGERLELEHLRFEKEARRRFKRAQVLAPVIENVSPISDVSAATAPVNEYAPTALLVHEALWPALMNVVCRSGGTATNTLRESFRHLVAHSTS